MTHLVIVNGYPRAGKDTLIQSTRDMLAAGGYSSANISMITATQDMLLSHPCIDPDFFNEKTPKVRQLLAQTHRALLDNTDLPIQALMDQIRLSRVSYVFSCCREPDTIQRVKLAALNQGWKVTTVYVHRQDHEAPVTAADACVGQYDYDHYVDNSGSIKQMPILVTTLLKTLRD